MSAAAPQPVDVPIRDEVIRLGQFLKLANLVETGADAKPAVAEGLVRVNGEVETRRGCQLVAGDVVELGGLAARVAASGSGDGAGAGGADDGGADDGGDGLPW